MTTESIGSASRHHRVSNIMLLIRHLPQPLRTRISEAVENSSFLLRSHGVFLQTVLFASDVTFCFPAALPVRLPHNPRNTTKPKAPTSRAPWDTYISTPLGVDVCFQFHSLETIDNWIQNAILFLGNYAGFGRGSFSCRFFILCPSDSPPPRACYVPFSACLALREAGFSRQYYVYRHAL